MTEENKCKVCGDKFEEKEDLIAHGKDNHPVFTESYAKELDAPNIFSHMMVSDPSSSEPFKAWCNHCGLETDSVYPDMKNHLQQTHDISVEVKANEVKIPSGDLYQYGSKVGTIRDYNSSRHEGYVTLDGIGIEEFGAMTSDFEVRVNGERIPNKWDGKHDYNLDLFGESKRKGKESRSSEIKKEIKRLQNIVQVASEENPMHMYIYHDKIDKLESELASLGEAKCTDCGADFDSDYVLDKHKEFEGHEIDQQEDKPVQTHDEWKEELEGLKDEFSTEEVEKKVNMGRPWTFGRTEKGDTVIVPTRDEPEEGEEADFKEEDHPRDGGKFTTKGGRSKKEDEDAQFEKSHGMQPGQVRSNRLSSIKTWMEDISDEGKEKAEKASKGKKINDMTNQELSDYWMKLGGIESNVGEGGAGSGPQEGSKPSLLPEQVARAGDPHYNPFKATPPSERLQTDPALSRMTEDAPEEDNEEEDPEGGLSFDVDRYNKSLKEVGIYPDKVTNLAPDELIWDTETKHYVKAKEARGDPVQVTDDGYFYDGNLEDMDKDEMEKYKKEHPHGSGESPAEEGGADDPLKKVKDLSENYRFLSKDIRAKIFESIGLNQGDANILAGLQWNELTRPIRVEASEAYVKEEFDVPDEEYEQEQREEAKQQEEDDEENRVYENFYNLEKYHSSPDFKKKAIECNRCNEKFYHIVDRDVHFNEVHAKEDVYNLPEECPFCKIELPEGQDLDYHMSTAHGAHVPSEYTQTGVDAGMADADWDKIEYAGASYAKEKGETYIFMWRQMDLAMRQNMMRNAGVSINEAGEDWEQLPYEITEPIKLIMNQLFRETGRESYAREFDTDWACPRCGNKNVKIKYDENGIPVGRECPKCGLGKESYARAGEDIRQDGWWECNDCSVVAVSDDDKARHELVTGHDMYHASMQPVIPLFKYGESYAKEDWDEKYYDRIKSDGLGILFKCKFCGELIEDYDTQGHLGIHDVSEARASEVSYNSIKNSSSSAKFENKWDGSVKSRDEVLAKLEKSSSHKEDVWEQQENMEFNADFDWKRYTGESIATEISRPITDKEAMLMFDKPWAELTYDEKMLMHGIFADESLAKEVTGDYWWGKHVKWESGMDQDFLYCNHCGRDLYVDASYHGDGSASDENVNEVVQAHMINHGITESYAKETLHGDTNKEGLFYWKPTDEWLEDSDWDLRDILEGHPKVDESRSNEGGKGSGRKPEGGTDDVEWSEKENKWKGITPAGKDYLREEPEKDDVEWSEKEQKWKGITPSGKDYLGEEEDQNYALSDIDALQGVQEDEIETAKNRAEFRKASKHTPTQYGMNWQKGQEQEEDEGWGSPEETAKDIYDLGHPEEAEEESPEQEELRKQGWGSLLDVAKQSRDYKDEADEQEEENKCEGCGRLEDVLSDDSLCEDCEIEAGIDRKESERDAYD